MGGHDGGAEGDVVAAVVPLVVGAGEEVFDVEELVVADAEMLEVEVDPSALLVEGIEVDGDEDDVGLRGCREDEGVGLGDVERGVVGGGVGGRGRRGLGVADDLRVVDVVEAE